MFFLHGLQEIGPIVAEVGAPAPLVYQMLGAIGQGAQRPGEHAEILERDGDRLVCDFWTAIPLPAGRRRLVRTREAVRLRPPDRVEYEHLDGPVRGLRESITIQPTGERRCRLIYRASYPGVGLLRKLGFRVLTGPAIRRAMEAHFAEVRERAELRATRSRMFPGSLPGDANLAQVSTPVGRRPDR